MNLRSIKPSLLLSSLLAISISPLFSQAPAVGTLIPEEITFGYLTTPVSELGQTIEFLPELEYVTYGDFPGEVVITLYHTPW